MDTVVNDGVFVASYKREGTKIVRKLEQPTRDAILNHNAELRKDENIQQDMTFGRKIANIPFEDFEVLRRKYPELTAGDSEQRQNCLMKILASSEGKKYLVRSKL